MHERKRERERERERKKVRERERLKRDQLQEGAMGLLMGQKFSSGLSYF